MITDDIRQYRVREAFWAAADNIAADTFRQTLFCQIVSIKNNIGFLVDDFHRIQALAEKGDSYMMFALARIHDVLQFDENSNTVKEMYYKVAAAHGIADAYAYLALMNKDADLGVQDLEAYNTLMDKALALNSEKALQHIMRNLVYGLNGSDRNPEKAYELADNYVSGLAFPNPAYYLIMADAAVELGRKDSALRNYALAAEYGNSTGYYWMAVVSCCDESGNVIDRVGFMELMDRGRELNSPDAFLMSSILVDEDLYAKLDESERQLVHASLKDDMTAGWLLGDNVCPYMLATYYEDGKLGFEQDLGQAWLWYGRSAVLRNGYAYAALARMITDGTAPERYDVEHAHNCQHMAEILGWQPEDDDDYDDCDDFWDAEV